MFLKFYHTVREPFLRYWRFLRSTQSSIARDGERELKTAPQGTLGGSAMLHWVFEEGEKWQACTNGLAEVKFGLWYGC